MPRPPVLPIHQVAPVAVALAQLPGTAGAALTITLDPVELGRVEVRIERRGEAEGDRVRILAERPETLALLQRDQRELARALDQAGVNRSAEGAMSFGLAGDNASGDRPGDRNAGGGAAGSWDRGGTATGDRQGGGAEPGGGGSGDRGGGARGREPGAAGGDARGGSPGLAVLPPRPRPGAGDRLSLVDITA